MDTLKSLKVFCTVVDAGSFAATAERLDLSTAMVSKHVAHLEKQLGSRLLNRTSRHLSLTEAGKAYYEQCREALDLLQSAEASLSDKGQTPHGTLRITAPVWCANAFFTEALAAYRRRYPEVAVEISLENRFVDLVEEGYDLALRATRTPSPTLIVRPLCELAFFIVAAPTYLDAHGRPDSPEALVRLDAILPTYTSMNGLALSHTDAEGIEHTSTARFNAVMKSNNSTLAYHAAHAGIGIAYLPGWMVADDLARGSLEQVLPNHRIPPITLYAAYTSRKFMTAKVRSFIDFMSGVL